MGGWASCILINVQRVHRGQPQARFAVQAAHGQIAVQTED